MTKSITVDNTEYTIIDQICNVALPDSFTKIKMGRGHGEGKLYLGNQNIAGFWGGKTKCFFLKEDFANYMKDASMEYKNPTQPYDARYSIEERYERNKMNVDDLTRSTQWFDIERSKVAPPRYYINIQRRDKPIWTLFRGIMLPTISHMTIFKMQDEYGETAFYFKPYLDYSYNSVHHDEITKAEISKIEETVEKETEKHNLQKSRIGQGTFKDRLIEEYGSCIITRIDDHRLLIGSHIKPWSKSSNYERLDKHNGLILSPTYDKLFDQGLLTFTDSSRLKLSHHLSDKNLERLGLEEDQHYFIPHIDNRAKYLKYHRNHVFMA